MRFYICCMALLFCIFILFPFRSFAQKNCLSCHNSWYNEKIDETSIHVPFLKGKCKVCHKDSDMDNVLDKNRQNNEYNWILSKYIFSGITLIPLAKDNNLLVKIVTSDNNINKIFHVKAEQSQSLTDINLNLPITISNLHVASITSDYLIHTKVVWHTNIPTKCDIYYGSSNNDKNISTEFMYSTNHILEIDGLKRNAKYFLYIIAYSPLNNNIKSSTIFFDTSNQFNNTASINNMDKNSNIEVKAISIDGQKYIEVNTPIDAYLKVALDDSADPTNKGISSSLAISDTSVKPTHLCSAEIYELGYKKCLDCHRSSQYNHNSHPINITLPPNMHPPKVLVLVNGKITCITCHCPHASNYPHQLRMKETTLCGCCHDLRHYAGLKIAQQYQFKNFMYNFSNM